jgi:hypothetical protein
MISREVSTIHNELKLIYPKSKMLAQEFGLLYPTINTYNESSRLIAQGLPFVKSIETPALEYLFEDSKLITKNEQEGTGFDVIYASVVYNKGYGPFTLVINPTVMQNGNFTAYTVDHASTYVSDVMKKTKLTESQVMSRYALTSDEFKEFYAFCIASVLDNPIDSCYSRNECEKLSFLTFDIGLPIIQLHDLKMIYYKNGWGGQQINLSIFQQKAKKLHLGFEIFYKTGTDLYSAEQELTDKISDDFNILPKFRNAIYQIA